MVIHVSTVRTGKITISRMLIDFFFKMCIAIGVTKKYILKLTNKFEKG